MVLTYSGWSAADGAIEAGAYAAVVEESGTCTLTASSGTLRATVSIPAVLDASTMACPGLQIPRGRLESGTWHVSATYESAMSAGTSTTVEVLVP